ncbi:hypothetical protein Slin15195_G093310 [Septoria linicola]|uniref:Uncharacterized protein n=1 Tax=Septoria linicola TaxID=215465 RepID=A0A9Q9EMX5_9PEZI|nr:hypothetical protein Slin14017_G056420 [Septoria linicola]USW56012.1 hypothetical protein Slin15195_G093310 [Septoria linicola]
MGSWTRVNGFAPIQVHQQQNSTSQAQQGGYYDSFLQSISNDIAYFLAKRRPQSKIQDTTPVRRLSLDDASDRINKRKSTKPPTTRAKHLKRRNSSPP